jgi:hypothetical protein
MSSDEETCSSHRNQVPVGKEPTVKSGSAPAETFAPSFSPAKDQPVKDQDSGYKSKNSEPKKEKKLYWNPPDIQIEDDSATKSFLASKLSDLTNMADKLKARLNQNSQPETEKDTNSSNLAFLGSLSSQNHFAQPSFSVSGLNPFLLGRNVTLNGSSFASDRNLEFRHSNLTLQGFAMAQAASASSLEPTGRSKASQAVTSQGYVVPETVTSLNVTSQGCSNQIVTSQGYPLPQTSSEFGPRVTIPQSATSSQNVQNYASTNFRRPEPNLERLVELSDEEAEDKVQFLIMTRNSLIILFKVLIKMIF